MRGDIITDFEVLTQERIDIALDMCNKYVGENLYTKEMLIAILDKKDHFFYFIVDKEHKPLGYIYFRIIDRGQFFLQSKADKDTFDREIPQNAVLGELKSIAVCEEYRSRGLSGRLIEMYLSFLAENTNADMAIGIFWSIHGVVPMKKSLEAFSFKFLQITHNVWYEFENLKCPYCEGRCVCDAAVYYKKIGGKK